MKLLIFLVLVSSHVLIDAKFVPNSDAKIATDHICIEELSNNACRARIVSVTQVKENLVIGFKPHYCSTSTLEVLEYKLGNGDFQQDDIALTEGVAIVPVTCEDITIRINTTIIGNKPGYCTYEHTTVFPAVTDLQVIAEENNKLDINWSVPTQIENCELKYQVKYIENGSTSNPTTCLSPDTCKLDISKVTYCRRFDILVTPYIGTHTPDSASSARTTYTKPLPSVTEVEAVPDPDSNGYFITSFEHLDNVDNALCGKVQYQVKQVDGSCFSSEISVQVVAKQTDGSSVITPSEPKPLNRGPGRVENLAYELIGDEVNIVWDVPVGGEHCSLLYLVSYQSTVEPITVSTHLTFVSVPNNAKACTTKNITIQASNGVDGPGTTVQVEGEFGRVKSIKCSHGAADKKVTCNWEAPDNTDGCSVTYTIRYFNGREEVENDVLISNLPYVFDLVDCSNNIWIQVTPTTYVGTEGEEDKKRVGVPIETVVDNVPGCTFKNPVEILIE